MSDLNKAFEYTEKDGRKVYEINYSTLAQLIVKDLKEANRQSAFFSKYKKEDVIRYLERPQQFEKELREMSNYLYIISSHYKRLIGHFAKMPLFAYDILPCELNLEKVKIDSFKKSYQKTLNYLDMMNLKHEFSKVSSVIFREDIFYGYEYRTNDSYFIQKLDPKYCTISSIEDGCFNFAFDFTYFDKKVRLVDTYAHEFQEKYRIYQKDKKNNRWQELDGENTICIKVNEDIDYPIPPFVAVFESLYDIQDYKALKKAKTELGNYKILVENIPMNKDGSAVNDFLLELDLAKAFHQKTVESVPDQVGVVLSPMEIEALDFKQDNATEDKVTEATNSFWSESGVSSNLFGGATNSGSTLSMGIKTDSAIVFGLLRQFERWTNRKLKYFNGAYKFKTEFLNVTVFNQEEISKKYLELAQYGLPTKQKVCISMGMTPSDIANAVFLENDVLKLHEKFIPLQSSFTTNSDNLRDGRPQKSDSELDNSGEQTRSNGSNDKGNRV